MTCSPLEHQVSHYPSTRPVDVLVPPFFAGIVWPPSPSHWVEPIISLPDRQGSRAQKESITYVAQAPLAVLK